ncbi:serine/threonine protein kinase [Prauserella marina]|uniref:non-specific serine/threonine protein kinase n=1 Tax=Prauserella marina TaxID=530584 RepID=A0A222VK62_9PSEU|nr:serine/threonine-protein kinase [Prauserella marina]ASR34163.1 serine/threonine protein kinase [Prauserella marina]PWV82813.1 serine/threonine protein kinase [Prauserella marina]SDC77890.1 Serine/threonine protein kinase [Prauserella marina]
MSDEGRLVAGRYRVKRRIGTGAMGAVWEAQDEILHRTVAIKQLLLQPGLEDNEAEDARKRTMREGRIAARLHHPNAITVFDVVTDDNGQPCLIMEYLASTSLAQELQKRKTLPPSEVAKIGAQVAAALKEAHAVGIVHRDIKPGNILLAGSGLVKITDFGISRAKDDVTVTKTGMIAGTPAYLAPEVAIGGDPGPESDVFSLGSTLYAATEGQPPFGLSENTLSLLHAVAAGQINPPRQSGPLTSVLAVMLHPDTRHRPTSEECEELLTAVARGETPLGGSPDSTTQVQPAVGGGTGTAVLGAAAAGAALGAAGAGDDYLPAGHSGTLGDGANGGYYGTSRDDRYEPADGYPDQDYDNYHAAQAGPGATRGFEATRAVPADDGYDNYDGYDDRGGYDNRGGRDAYGAAAYDEPPADEPEAKSNWKIPAIVGSIVVIGMAAFAIWVFGGSGGGDAEQDPQRPAATTQNLPTTTTSSSQVTTEPEPTSEVVESSTYEPPVQPPPVEPSTEAPPPTSDEVPTTEPEPEPTTDDPPQPTTEPSEPPSETSASQ